MASVRVSFAATAMVAAGLSALTLSAPQTAPALTDATATASCSPGSEPVVRLVPAHGPVGTRVRISGRCFSRHWNSGYGIFLGRRFIKPRECEIIAGGAFALRVDRKHRARGWFKVARDGACFQQPYRRRVTPGRYDLGIGCHACAAAHFLVNR